MKINAWDIQLGDFINDHYQKGTVVDYWLELNPLKPTEIPYITIIVQKIHNMEETTEEIYGLEDTIEILPKLPNMTF